MDDTTNQRGDNAHVGEPYGDVRAATDDAVDIRARATILDAHAGADTEREHQWVRHDVEPFGRKMHYWTCDVCNGFMPGLVDVPNDADALALYTFPCIPKAERAAAIASLPHTPLHVVMLHKTCSACPSQWEGMTSDGRCVYIRYRSGYGRIGVGDTVDDAVDDDQTFIWYGDDPFDGYITLEQVVALAPDYITFEPGIDDRYDADLADTLEAVQAMRTAEKDDGVLRIETDD